MNKRLIWNFEINQESVLDFNALNSYPKEDLGWESRYFWPEDDIVQLYGLPDDFLDISKFKIKQRQDVYFIFPDKDYNIKERHGEILYKPLMENTQLCQGFAKKIDLHSLPREYVLPGMAPLSVDLLLAALPQSKKITVNKTALTYKFSTTPTLKLELARLCISNKCYFSASLEGKSKALVESVSCQLFKQSQSCDYIHFLKQIRHD